MWQYTGNVTNLQLTSQLHESSQATRAYLLEDPCMALRSSSWLYPRSNMGKKCCGDTTSVGCQCRHPTSSAGRTTQAVCYQTLTEQRKQVEPNKKRCCLTALYPPLPFPDGFIIRIQFRVVLIRQSWCVLPSAAEYTSELTRRGWHKGRVVSFFTWTRAKVPLASVRIIAWSCRTTRFSMPISHLGCLSQFIACLRS